MDFAQKTMDFAQKTMDFVLETMDFVLETTDSVLEMTDFTLQWSKGLDTRVSADCNINAKLFWNFRLKMQKEWRIAPENR